MPNDLIDFQSQVFQLDFRIVDGIAEAVVQFLEGVRALDDFVRNGGIGKLKVVQAVNYTGPTLYEGLPEEPIPAGDDWDMWCGPTELRSFNKQLQFSWMKKKLQNSKVTVMRRRLRRNWIFIDPRTIDFSLINSQKAMRKIYISE